MTNYKRLNDLEREEISRMLSQKCSFSDIAKALGRYRSTISREVNGGSAINILTGRLQRRIEPDVMLLKGSGASIS